MLNSEDYKYQYIGMLKLMKSDLVRGKYPKEDVVKWLFVKCGGRKFSFVYKILNEEGSFYNVFFEVEIYFLMNNFLKNILRFNELYEVFRGEEKIGLMKIVRALPNTSQVKHQQVDCYTTNDTD